MRPPQGAHRRDLPAHIPRWSRCSTGPTASWPASSLVPSSSTARRAIPPAAAASRRASRRSGFGFVDAPVSGGTNGAEAGTLTVMVGWRPAIFDRAAPVLSAFGSRIVRMGPVGSGHAMKAVNNALLAVNILAVGEGLAALVKAGVPARTALDVLNASSGRSFVSETLVPERVLTGAFPKTFKLTLLQKDAGIAAGLLRETGVPAPMIDLALQLYGEARASTG